MKNNNYHHVYKFAPIAIEVILTAIVPVGFVTAFIQHPILVSGQKVSTTSNESVAANSHVAKRANLPAFASPTGVN